MCRHATASYRSEAAAALAGERFDAIHVMRTYMAPYAGGVAARCSERVVLRIAGSAPAPDFAALAGLPGVELVADPVDLTECYAWADLAVVPLTAGGGTRIKMLEAFAHGVPVVATSIGAEGIAAMHDVHLLIADSPAAFADACASVLADRVLAARLADAARALVEARYAHAHGVRDIRDAFDRLYSA